MDTLSPQQIKKRNLELIAFAGQDISLAKISHIPEGLKVGGGFYSNDIKITSIPEGLKVG